MTLDRRTPVLVVDDEAIMRDLMARILAALGFKQVDCVEDGYSALTRMRQTRFGVVICDWSMEPINGYELLKQVRADPALSWTPFILATTQTVVANAVAAKGAGVDRYLIKPFTVASLANTLNGLRAPPEPVPVLG